MVFSRILAATTLSALILAGCAQKKVQPETSPEVAAVPIINPDALVQTQDINYDSQGSDSNHISGLNTVHFDFDKSNLTTEARLILANNAKWILGQPQNIRLSIEGHTDTRGSIEYNLALGERRAKSVKEYMVSLGVDAGRMMIISYGKERLVDQGTGELAHAKNRRANFVPVQATPNLSQK